MPKNPLYLRENCSVLLTRKYKLAYILVFLGNKKPPYIKREKPYLLYFLIPALA